MRDHNFHAEMNARHLWHPFAHPGEMRDVPPKVIASASGVRITDDAGHETIDAVGGLWCVNLGYSCDPIKEAIAAQLASLPYYSAFKGTTNGPAIELSVELARILGEDGMARAFLTSGGSDSVDTALKLARQYHKLRGEAGRTKFIALRKGYHGTHFGGGSVNGNTAFRAPYEPLLPGVFHVPSPYGYRNPFDEEDPERLARLCLRALEEEIAFQDPSTVAAFIMESVQGAGGVIVPHESYMPGVREICDRHGVLLISDEVITGFGRAGAVSGARLWGVQPDMMTCAKAITSGYFPMGAVMASERVAEAFEGKGGAMVPTGYTYSGHPVGCAAALACLAETERLALWDCARDLGPRLLAGLEGLRRHEAVGDVRGQGLMAAVEIVSDRDARTADPARAGRIFEAAYRAGAMVRWSGANLVCSPPLTIEAEDVDRVVAALDEGLSEAA
ncbi:aminotransferase class III-fold pyridoxal phosphate-dependent enzyme [Jannaschia sp. W003]|uniref:aminotransferase class III-fold pyridoxal phosphate-dependent enzyme n=1 Tax=Jannaschia sp. W003 TaxID=2867012 RepID=UPI0021A84122|nr:aminotransferase class III-fold pyridoxal phosphate-dependent enzyme [Jannaschia sp. W003]UWQ22703.1 aminotransferase class III-fold pyridoxal phosphate-dependent enzyme [Jannaschia sp. W003]